jgi:hypothetical protein
MPGKVSVAALKRRGVSRSRSDSPLKTSSGRQEKQSHFSIRRGVFGNSAWLEFSSLRPRSVAPAKLSLNMWSREKKGVWCRILPPYLGAYVWRYNWVADPHTARLDGGWVWETINWQPQLKEWIERNLPHGPQSRWNRWCWIYRHWVTLCYQFQIKNKKLLITRSVRADL